MHFAADSPRAITLDSLQASAFIEQTRFDEAEAMLHRAHERMAQHPAEQRRLADIISRIVHLYEVSGRTELAEEWRQEL